jgi:demethylmenaquinone methyltransferase/2-methoxy-6-polyprenyl-1,4-benzoquinol methylase
MMNPSGSHRAQSVQSMFARIAPHYDSMNRLITIGQDVRWRQEVIRRTALPLGGCLLDLGAGTGDLADEALRKYPESQMVAADFTLEMMQVGRTMKGASLAWTGADALYLPFPAGSFDAVVSGYLLRNVSDLPQALCEQRRVLKSGGRIVALDTTRPPRNILSPFINFHLHTVIPALGRLLTGDTEAYTYLPDSTQGFLSAEQLAARLVQAGFRQVGFRRLMFGTMAIHWGVKEGN